MQVPSASEKRGGCLGIRGFFNFPVEPPGAHVEGRAGDVGLTATRAAPGSGDVQPLHPGAVHEVGPDEGTLHHAIAVWWRIIEGGIDERPGGGADALLGVDAGRAFLPSDMGGIKLAVGDLPWQRGGEVADERGEIPHGAVHGMAEVFGQFFGLPHGPLGEHLDMVVMKGEAGVVEVLPAVVLKEELAPSKRRVEDHVVVNLGVDGHMSAPETKMFLVGSARAHEWNHFASGAGEVASKK